MLQGFFRSSKVAFSEFKNNLINIIMVFYLLTQYAKV